MRPHVQPLTCCLAALPLLSRRELGCCIDMMIARLDQLDGDADLEAEIDLAVDDEGEEELAA